VRLQRRPPFKNCFARAHIQPLKTARDGCCCHHIVFTRAGCRIVQSCACQGDAAEIIAFCWAAVDDVVAASVAAAKHFSAVDAAAAAAETAAIFYCFVQHRDTGEWRGRGSARGSG
jgi:hypothetical protein